MLAVTALALYSWTLIWFFWKLGSWLHFLTAGEILTVLAYGLATNALESLLVAALPTVLAVLLPAPWFRERFVAQASWLILILVGYLIVFANQFRVQEEYPAAWIGASPVIFLLALFVSYFLARWSFLRVAAETLADRAIIFLYLLGPMSVVSLAVVVLRNMH